MDFVPCIFTDYTLIVLYFSGCLQLFVLALEDHTVEIDLRLGYVRGYSPYITFLKSPKPSRTDACDCQAAVKLDLSSKYKGVKFHLHYGQAPQLWTFHVSDSASGDGYGEDVTSSNNAEAHIHNRQLRVYGNKLPGYMDATINGGALLRVVDNVVKNGTKTVIDVSDERIQWIDDGKKHVIESKFLFALSGQKSLTGLVDYDLYAGFNRVVGGQFRNGSGLCMAKIILYEGKSSVSSPFFVILLLLRSIFDI